MTVQKILQVIVALLFAATIFHSCSVQNMSQKASTGAMIGVNAKADSLGWLLAHGAMVSLTDPVSKKRISQLLDSIMVSMMDTMTPRITGLRDSVMNHKTLLWADSLLQVLTGDQLRLNVDKLQASVMGKTKSDIYEIENSVRKLIDDLLNDKTQQKIGALRDELLGAKTDSAISKIVETALDKVNTNFKTKIIPTMNNELSFLKRYAEELLFALGFLALAIILVIGWSRRKYVRTIQILTKHIDLIPDQNIYDVVAQGIKSDAISNGLQEHLHDVLVANRLVGTEWWKHKK